MILPQTLRAMIAAMMGEEYPSLSLAGKWTYRVDKVTVAGGVRCNISPVEGNPQQGHSNVDQWPGVGGAVVVPEVGCECLVEFRDNARDRPVIVAFQPHRLTGGKPTVATIDGALVRVGPNASAVELAVDDATIGRPVARVGDAIAGGSFTATGVAPGSPIIFTFYPPGTSPPGPPPPAGAVCTIAGIITEGSAKVTSG